MRLVYQYETGDEHSGYSEQFVGFEAESKEDLVIELTCALIDFQKEQAVIQKEVNKINEQAERARVGGHKSPADFNTYLKLRRQGEEMREKMETFSFKGKTYPMSIFIYQEEKDQVLCDLSLKSQTLDEWFQQQQTRNDF